jgi:hypothetical protein
MKLLVLFIFMLLVSNSIGQDYDSYVENKIASNCNYCIHNQKKVMVSLMTKNLTMDSIGYLFYMHYSGIPDSIVINSKYFVDGKSETVHFIQLEEKIILVPESLPLKDKKRYAFLRKLIRKESKTKYEYRLIRSYLKKGLPKSGGPDL